MPTANSPHHTQVESAMRITFSASTPLQTLSTLARCAPLFTTAGPRSDFETSSTRRAWHLSPSECLVLAYLTRST